LLQYVFSDLHLSKSVFTAFVINYPLCTDVPRKKEKINLTATPAFLQQKNQYHSQFGVAISVKYHGFYETERLFLGHLGDEIACANFSDAPQQKKPSFSRMRTTSCGFKTGILLMAY
jgi:hypothetical protein